MITQFYSRCLPPIWTSLLLLVIPDNRTLLPVSWALAISTLLDRYGQWFRACFGTAYQSTFRLPADGCRATSSPEITITSVTCPFNITYAVLPDLFCNEVNVAFLEAHGIEEQFISQCILQDPLTLNIRDWLIILPPGPLQLPYGMRYANAGVIAGMTRSWSYKRSFTASLGPHCVEQTGSKTLANWPGSSPRWSC